MILMVAVGTGLGNASALTAAPAVPAWRLDTPWSTERAMVRFERDAISAEIADTGFLRSRGLGFRDALPEDAGMLFVYEDAGVRSFWMRGMRFCLDIIWIEEGEVVGAAKEVCPEPGDPDSELEHYASPEPVTYVLEMNAGWLERNGYGPGSPVEVMLPA
jgi:uncharacterized membrane protein (UPF0127 family)